MKFFLVSLSIGEVPISSEFLKFRFVSLIRISNHSHFSCFSINWIVLSHVVIVKAYVNLIPEPNGANFLLAFQEHATLVCRLCWRL